MYFNKVNCFFEEVAYYSKYTAKITYSFNDVAGFGLIPISLFMIASIFLAIIAFNKNMVSDK